MPQLDLYIDPTTGDLDFSDQLRMTETGGEAIAQKVKIRLNTFFKEWILNTDQGTKWFEVILTKGVSPEAVNQEINKRVLGTKGVRAMENYVADFDRRNRTFSCSFDIITDFDDVATVTIEDFSA